MCLAAPAVLFYREWAHFARSLHLQLNYEKFAFPSILTRKQYLIRLLFLVGVVLVALICFVGAPTGRAAQVVGIVYVAIVIIAVFYHIFGLVVPRLRSARISLWAALLVFIPLRILVLIGICLFAPEKSSPPPVDKFIFGAS